MSIKDISDNANRLKFTLLQRGINEDWINEFLTELIVLNQKMPTTEQRRDLAFEGTKYVKDTALMEKVIAFEAYSLGMNKMQDIIES